MGSPGLLRSLTQGVSWEVAFGGGRGRPAASACHRKCHNTREKTKDLMTGLKLEFPSNYNKSRFFIS